jgi:1-acyl-sn-glycerol-3-phosphate acyltransferase
LLLPAYLTAVLFAILKGYVKLAVKIICRKIIINNQQWLTAKGPLLLACNHPNSFLDGIILTALFKENIYSLARGDAFRTPWHGQVLRWLNLLPVYRTSEGVENLDYNYATFEACREVFRKNGIVIIFSEGRCINEWHLRPLRKGTARLATSAWEEGINLTVLPVGFNYNTFRNFGKNVFIHFGSPLCREDVMLHQTDGRMFLTFNEQLRTELQTIVYEIDPLDQKTKEEKLSVPVSLQRKVILAVPAFLGFVLHVPFYYAGKLLTLHYFDNDHFDSALASMLVVAYPPYLLLLSLLAGMFFNWWIGVVVFLALPFCAWSCVQLKRQI